MKKLLLFSLIAVFALAFSSCKKGADESENKLTYATPEDVVEEFIEACLDNDGDRAWDVLCDDDGNLLDKDEHPDLYSETCQKSTLPPEVNYEIKGSEIDDYAVPARAGVRVKFFYQGDQNTTTIETIQGNDGNWYIRAEGIL